MFYKFTIKYMVQTSVLEYYNPEVLIDTQWVEEHLLDNNIRIVEVDYDSGKLLFGSYTTSRFA